MFTKKTRSLYEFKIYFNSFFFFNLCFDNCNWLICTYWSGFLLTKKIYWSIINFYLPIIFVPAWSDNKRNSSADWKKHRNNDKRCSWLFRNIHGDKIVADDGDGGESKNTDLSWFYFRPKSLCLGFEIFLDNYKNMIALRLIPILWISRPVFNRIPETSLPLTFVNMPQSWISYAYVTTGPVWSHVQPILLSIVSCSFILK